MVAIVAIEVVVEAGEVVHFSRDVPIAILMLDADIVDVVVQGTIGHADLLAHHNVDVLIIGAAADHSRPSGSTEVVAPVVDEFPVALTLGGTIVKVDASGVRSEDFAFTASGDARPARLHGFLTHLGEIAETAIIVVVTGTTVGETGDARGVPSGSDGNSAISPRGHTVAEG